MQDERKLEGGSRVQQGRRVKQWVKVGEKEV